MDGGFLRKRKIKMNKRQKIRAIIAISMLILVVVIAFLAGFFPIYLEVLKTISIPFGIVLSGYFGTEIAKNIKKNDKIKEQNSKLG
jgi:uncharacterized membrane protein (DUF485 family)